MATQTDATAQDLYANSVVIDGLNVSNWDSPAVYESLSSGGVTAINATIATWDNFLETLNNITGWMTRFREMSGVVTQVTTSEDIRQAKRDGKVGVILGFQNASPIENNLERLALFHVLGVRIIQVTYHEANLLGSGCYERYDYGLTHFGVDAVREMNRLGILMDLSHVGVRTTMDTIELSEQPVAITHANARSYHDMARNKELDAIKLLAEKGGVIGATCITSMLRTGFDSTIEDYVDAIDYLVEQVGIDHVGIGTDYTQDQPVSFWKYISAQQGTSFPLKAIADAPPIDYATVNYYPTDLGTPDKLPNLTRPLLDRGYKPDDVAKVLGGNWLSLFEQVWRG